MVMGGPRGTLYSGGSRALSGRSREEVKGQAGLSTGIQAHAVKGLEIKVNMSKVSGLLQYCKVVIYVKFTTVMW